jgi:hypothetical protein
VRVLVVEHGREPADLELAVIGEAAAAAWSAYGLVAVAVGFAVPGDDQGRGLGSGH